MAKSKWPQVKDKLMLVEKWKRDGLTELQIAINLGISKATLEEYKKQHPDFLDAIKKGKEIFITEIENALATYPGAALGTEWDAALAAGKKAQPSSGPNVNPMPNAAPISAMPLARSWGPVTSAM